MADELLAGIGSETAVLGPRSQDGSELQLCSGRYSQGLAWAQAHAGGPRDHEVVDVNALFDISAVNSVKLLNCSCECVRA